MVLKWLRWCNSSRNSIQTCKYTIAKTSKFFTGKEFNVGAKMKDFLFARQEEMEEGMEEINVQIPYGVFTKLGDRLTGLKDNMIAGAKTLGKSGKELVSKGFASLVNGLKFLGKNFMRMGSQVWHCSCSITY